MGAAHVFGAGAGFGAGDPIVKTARSAAKSTLWEVCASLREILASSPQLPYTAVVRSEAVKRHAGLGILLVAGIVTAAPAAAPTTTFRAAVYAVRTDGSGRVLLAEPDPAVPNLARSRGGRSILFNRIIDGDVALFAADLSGANAIRLTPKGVSASFATAAFAPDGRSIAFTSYVVCGFRCARYTLQLVARDGSGLRVLAEESGWPSWSPDGTRLAYDGRDGISVLDLRTDETTVVAPRPGGPSWAPRGERIAYYAVEGGYGVACFVDADGSDRVCTHGHSLTSLTWSRDGMRVAFRQATPRRLGIVNPNTARVRYLGYRGRMARPAAWSPDGRRLAYWFGSYGSFSGNVFVLNVAEPRRPRKLFTEGTGWMSDLRWRAGGLTYVAIRPE